MKSWTPIILLIILGILGAGIGFLVTGFGRNNQQTPPMLVDQKQPKTITAQLILEPETASVRIGNPLTYNVKVNVDAVSVFAAELHLTFDPQKVSVLELEPGSLFADPEVLLQNIDTQTGTITYSIGSFNPVVGGGTMMRVKVQPKQLLTSTETILTFDQKKTKVSLGDKPKQILYTEKETSLTYVEQPLQVIQ